MKEIRRDVRKKFYQLAKREGINITNEVELLKPDDFLILLEWKSEGLNKIMSLREDESDSIFNFCYIVDKMDVYSEGHGYEKYDYVTVFTKASHQQVELIFELYKLWFIENKTAEEMENILVDYFTKLNGHSPEYFARRHFEKKKSIDREAVISAIEAMMNEDDK